MRVPNERFRPWWFPRREKRRLVVDDARAEPETTLVRLIQRMHTESRVFAAMLAVALWVSRERDHYARSYLVLGISLLVACAPARATTPYSQ